MIYQTGFWLKEMLKFTKVFDMDYNIFIGGTGRSGTTLCDNYVNYYKQTNIALDSR